MYFMMEAICWARWQETDAELSPTTEQQYVISRKKWQTQASTTDRDRIKTVFQDCQLFCLIVTMTGDEAANS